MNYFLALVLGILLFIATLLIHFAVWRTLEPKRQMFWLFLLFVSIPILSVMCALALGAPLETSLGALVLALALGATYVITYPAAQAQSPTLILLLFLNDRQRNGGASREEIYQFFSTRSTLAERLADLERDGLVTTTGQSRQGQALTKFFLFMRTLLKIRETG